MRRLAILLLLVVLPTFAKDKSHSVVTPRMHCYKLQPLLTELKNTYGEDPIFIGKSELEKGTTMMFVNQETGSYTVIGLNKNVGCVLDIGGEMRYRMPAILENKLL